MQQRCGCVIQSWDLSLSCLTPNALLACVIVVSKFRPPPDFPSSAQQELGHVSNPNDMHLHDSSVGGGGGGGDTWIRHVSGAASEDLAGSARQSRHTAQRGHRQDNRRGAATDPEMAGEGVPFAFQLDDGRLPAGGGGPPLSSSLDWMGGEGVDDAEGVHKRSLNGTSKGVSPAAGVSAAGPVSPRDEGDLIHRDSPGTMRQQLPQVMIFFVSSVVAREPSVMTNDRPGRAASCWCLTPRQAKEKI